MVQGSQGGRCHGRCGVFVDCRTTEWQGLFPHGPLERTGQDWVCDLLQLWHLSQVKGLVFEPTGVRIRPTQIADRSLIPASSLCFWYEKMERSVRVEGTTERLTDAESQGTLHLC